ncbi:MAG: hypothetical protein A3E82_03195 [Gammaproteobacteria bacterium RIFCSPHIGHO2_12_FULL_38_11]|nr:MAG: hypothetical protein A3E82_03195 [Gammaproteobacteria bacterium RIFCSPHIGHO2_12_FULL_38_11]
MKTHLENEQQEIGEITHELDALARSLDHQHRQQRKIQFLLDIRGYFIVNKIIGAYAEFGLYRGEMMYSAHKILQRSECIAQYVGLDTFSGEPSLTHQDQHANPFLKVGDFLSDYEITHQFLTDHIGSNVRLIKGDFRTEDVRKEFSTVMNIALCVIDCNLLSSIEAALQMVILKMLPSSVLFMDDYFINMGEGKCETETLLKKICASNKRQLIEYKTYPPCSRAFLLL